jgi:hypothetical protein
MSTVIITEIWPRQGFFLLLDSSAGNEIEE